MASISDSVSTCLHQFRALSSSLEDADTGDAEPLPGLSPLLVKDQLARFKVWSGNIGAHRKGRSSLDFRLRDASHIHAQVKQPLEDLVGSLHDGESQTPFGCLKPGDAFKCLSVDMPSATSICRGETTPWDREPLEETDNTEDDNASPPGPAATELSQISEDISEILDCLFRLSVSIRNPAPHERFLKSSLTDTSHHEPFDLFHVLDMFPLAEPALAERLGRALSRRRQYFLYRKVRHKKFSFGLEEDDEMTEEAGVSTIASSITENMKQATSDATQPAVLDEDRLSEAGWTDTTRGSSLAEGDRPRIPPLPKDAHERPFECPFCYMMISATTTAAWTYATSPLGPSRFCFGAHITAASMCSPTSNPTSVLT